MLNVPVHGCLRDWLRCGVVLEILLMIDNFIV
ncbi:hypothetical protein X989_4930 [Burkholderia pseudomallei MSHR4378]|nr:hypothetical protein X989_4930 [Burkholderia pseudomallei MSHR4378]